MNVHTKTLTMDELAERALAIRPQDRIRYRGNCAYVDAKEQLAIGLKIFNDALNPDRQIKRSADADDRRNWIARLFNI
jgi:hypothetical protein